MKNRWHSVLVGPLLLIACASNSPTVVSPTSTVNMVCGQPSTHAGKPGADDLAASYSSTSNPSTVGHFSYGWQRTRQEPFMLYEAKGAVLGSPSWQNTSAPFGGCFTGGCNLPVLWKNDSCGAQNHGAAHIPPQTVAFHPGMGGELSVVRWTCPEAGRYQIRAWFEARDTTTSDISVVLNGSRPELLWVQITPQSPGEFEKELALQAGDTLDFAVGPGSNGNIVCDSTGIQVVVERI